LDRDVEGVGGESVNLLRRAEDLEQIERRVVENAGAIEPAQSRIPVVQAEYALEPPHLGERALAQQVRRGRVGVMDLQRGIGAQRGTGPQPAATARRLRGPQ
jgi:hypothetical protein